MGRNDKADSKLDWFLREKIFMRVRWCQWIKIQTTKILRSSIQEQKWLYWWGACPWSQSHDNCSKFSFITFWFEALVFPWFRAWTHWALQFLQWCCWLQCILMFKRRSSKSLTAFSVQLTKKSRTTTSTSLNI